MKTVWTLVCYVALAAALTACKSSAPAPAEGEPAADSEAPADTAKRLQAERVFVVERRGGVRASPHFYNDASDLERLLKAL